MVYTKCNPNFQSQYCYLDNLSININDYLNNKSAYEKSTISCNKGHPLVFVNSENRKKHFRHKNTSDMEGHAMSEWHSEWQGHFPNTEIPFLRKEGQVRERRADVVLNDTIIVELQHSHITPEEVFSRKNDYFLHGREIVWILDGSKVEKKYLESTNRYFLYFNVEDSWKYRSFDLYESVYLDISGSIFKLFPKLVRNGMTDVSEPKSKDEFITALFNGQSLWDDTHPPQCELYVKQEGAGNGKTYGIIQRIVDPSFSHYKTFIYVTKQHSAKYIMFDELRKQLSFEEFEDYEAINKTNSKNKKQYVYDIVNKKSGEVKHIIFATIDSFMHSIGEQNNSAYDLFLGIINNIIQDDPQNSLLKITSNSSIRFANDTRKLNKETIFIVDECQDLATDYARAIIKIMRATYMDCLVVGDILQSIHHERNAFRFFMERSNDDEIAPFIKRTILPQKNICRRFNKKELVDFVNSIVNFNYNDMGLPYVEAANPFDDPYKSIHFFRASTKNIDEESLVDEESEDKSRLRNTDKDVEDIMNLFQEEVYTNKREPNDFLFITPFTSNNLLAQELELQIHLFWEKQLGVVSTFQRYAVFHRSQEGTSINLDESKDATRIVSCHAAKGDGRKVVFLIGFTEKTITTFSKRTDSLIFESMINVMFTRMKEKLYIQYSPNGDNLHRRYYKYSSSIEDRVLDVIPVLPVINKFMKLNKLIDYYDGEENWKFFQPIVDETKTPSVNNGGKDKRILDMTHHTIRKQIMDMMFMMSIIDKERNMTYDPRKKQFLRIFENIAKTKPIICQSYSAYVKSLAILEAQSKPSKSKNESLKNFPILNLKASTREGVPYSEILSRFMSVIASFTGDFVNKKQSRLLCPLEAIILYFMNEIIRRGRFADMTIFYLYDILDKYENAFKDSNIHKECSCRSYFKETINENANDLFHIKHFETLITIQENVKNIYTRNPKIAWLNNYDCYFNGGSNNFALVKQFAFHGYDDEKQETILFYLKPQFNQLNEKDTMINILMDTWLLMNFNRKREENIQKYHGKKIRACILSLESEEPLFVDVNSIVKKYESTILQEVFNRWASQFLQSHEAIYYYYNYYREEAKREKKSIKTFSTDFIKRIKEHYDDDEGSKEVSYIRDFFLGLSLDNDMIPLEMKQLIISQYDDKEKFIGSLTNKLCKELANYLGTEIDDETEEQY
jgi:hypothetical protein